MPPNDDDYNSLQSQQFARDAFQGIVIGAITVAGLVCMFVTIFADQLYKLIFLAGGSK